MIKPGIFESNFGNVIKKISLVEIISPVIHIDIADGILVDGKTFEEIDKIENIETAAYLELHLMVNRPVDYILPSYGNVTTIISQIEAENIANFIQVSKDFGYQIGLSLMPESSIESVMPFIDQIDLVQLMTVHPGGQGRPFVDKVVTHLKDLKEKCPNCVIQVDGAMNKDHIAMIESEIDIDHYVVGSQIFGAKSPLLEEQIMGDLIN